MKRKLFTLLSAIVALAAFQVNAQQQGSWILADTSGLRSNVLYNDYFSANKLGLYNWLSWDATGKIYAHSRIDTANHYEIYDDEANNKFTVTTVNGNDYRFKIKSEKGQAFLSKEWGGTEIDQFEIVQFPGNTRTAQKFGNDSIEGYLALPQGDEATKAYSPELVLAGVNKNGVISFKKFVDYACYLPGNAAVSPVLSYQFDSTKVNGRLYLTGSGSLQVYTKKWNGEDSTKLIAGNDEYHNWSTAGASTPIVFAYNDFRLSTDGKEITANGVTVKLNDIITYAQSEGLNAVKSTTTLPSSADADKLFIVGAGGELKVTMFAPTEGAPGRWTNGQPITVNNTTYYYFDLSNPATFVSDIDKIQINLFGVKKDQMTSKAYIYKNFATDDFRPLYIKVTPSCAPQPYEYVTVKYLTENLLDISAALQNIVGTTAYVDNADYAGISKEEADRAPFLFEFMDSIKPDGSLLNLPAGTFNNSKNVQLFYIKGKDGKYLTVGDTTVFTNILTPDSTVTNTQLKWVSGKLTGVDTLRQAFAIIRDKTNGNLTLLPVASYKWKSKDGKEAKYGTQLHYNKSIGTESKNACGDLFVDLSATWYITQLSKVGGGQKLIIADPNSAQASNEIIWFKITPQFTEGSIACETGKAVAIYDKNGKKADGKGKYYTLEGLATGTVTDGMLRSHWTVKKEKEVQIGGLTLGKYRFTPEVDSIYDIKLSRTALINGKDSLFFIRDLGEGKLELISDTSKNGAYAPYRRDTVTYDCIGHSSPFLNLDEFVGSSKKVAILESLYKDRNISYLPADLKIAEPKFFGDKIEAFIRKVNIGETDSYSWVTVYKSNERYLDKNKKHKVPYYVFSYNKNGVEYFLKAQEGTHQYDSVRWVKLSANERAILLDWETGANRTQYADFKFCLPFVDGKDWNTSAEVYAQPVYLQTLDGYDNFLNGNDFINGSLSNAGYGLVKAGDETGLLTYAPFGVLNNYPSSVLFNANIPYYNDAYGIYSALENYGTSNMRTISSWIFANEDLVGSDWVRINAIVDDPTGKRDGALSNVDNVSPGVIYVAPSANTPQGTEQGKVNYGVLTDQSQDIELTVEFSGEAKIGYAKDPVWYYHIRNKATGAYLADAIDSISKPAFNYTYTYQGSTNTQTYAYGYFAPNYLGDENAYKVDDIYADKKFRQTFGLKYYKTAEDREKSYFVVVSGADYKSNNPTFRFLGRVGNRLVFVNRIEDALKLQWWAKKSDGTWTGLDVINAAAKIYGVAGGVKVINASDVVSVYAIDGRLVTSKVAGSPDQTIALPAGIYIVKSGANVVKVVVK
jgi:hypothetical protein